MVGEEVLRGRNAVRFERTACIYEMSFSYMYVFVLRFYFEGRERS